MNPYTLAAAKLTPAVFRRLFEVIPEPRWDERTDPDRFTPREELAHLADWEPIFRDRIQAALEEDLKPVPDIDEGALAIERQYHTRDVHEQLARFADERAKTCTLIESLSPEQMERRFNHAKRGPIKISELANMLSAHDVYHIEHLTEYLGEKTAATW